ncbi:DUF4142 domain-containing protein [Planotetraspora kaengkrachanensis]|uniref:DUF4142 domain-containing protein n=1 Tax=Planotetraspora kaengkrachanensis TaxID=575193 RepID=A0A8J3LZJ5_9ACTN|nr:DUF4142 domain-containing protein [Planotetraspora kaengkrachanensis]GIG79625.1 hypothetical protein Pka01_27520 [Planotetraspora kaengkrachanensis]
MGPLPISLPFRRGSEDLMLTRLIALIAIMSGTLVGSTSTYAAATPEVNEQDRTFLLAAHQGNLAEIKAGQVAQKQATTEAVRDMGARLIRDHKALDDDGGRVADQVGVALPDEPSDEQQVALEQVSGKKGAEFDRAWVASQITGHRKTLTAVATELSNGSSEQVKRLARDAKPVVQEHLDLLESIQRQND